MAKGARRWKPSPFNGGVKQHSVHSIEKVHLQQTLPISEEELEEGNHSPVTEENSITGTQNGQPTDFGKFTV